MIGFLVEALVLAVLAVIAFLLTKYGLNEAEADPIIRKVVLLIVLLLFLLAVFNLLSGHSLWGPILRVNAP